MDMRLQGEFFAMLCLGAILVSVVIAHSTHDVKLNDPRERTARRLTAMQGMNGELQSLSWLGKPSATAAKLHLLR
ncbi:hypothetical protein DKX38_020597 [Salix brachista]|uniref:Uncharacterized protein n=1 Tax=Salix brachista TaxID=2182728 RepID=A0A5N5KAJ2_9ROSI|nr:hypothetical protein DKX38_020597 [Salix brachista]